MEGRFDLLVTADRNIYTQRNLLHRNLSILVLPTNRRRDMPALGDRVPALIDAIAMNTCVVLERTGEVQTTRFKPADDAANRD